MLGELPASLAFTKQEVQSAALLPAHVAQVAWQRRLTQCEALGEASYPSEQTHVLGLAPTSSALVKQEIQPSGFSFAQVAQVALQVVQCWASGAG
jgi:hypothetical protein